MQKIHPELAAAIVASLLASTGREGRIVNLADLLGGCRHRRQLDQALALVEKRQAQLASFTVAAAEADFLEQLRAFLLPPGTATEAQVDSRIRADEDASTAQASPAREAGSGEWRPHDPNAAIPTRHAPIPRDEGPAVGARLIGSKAELKELHAEIASDARASFTPGSIHAGAGINGPADPSPSEFAALHQVTDELGAHAASITARLNERLPRGFFAHVTIARKD